MLIVTERRRTYEEIAQLKAKLAKYNIKSFRFFSLYELQDKDYNKVFLSAPDTNRTFSSLVSFKKV